MLRFFMGEQTFLKGLQDYLQEKKYSNAFHDDLFNALDQRAQTEGKHFPANIKDIMDTWISQMNYPVVKVTKSSSGAVHVEQKRFLVNDPSTDPGQFVSKFNYIWKVPFTFRTSDDGNFDVSDADVKWIMDSGNDILGSSYPTGQGKWILGNVHQYGFYRVNYDDDNWMALMNQLKQQHTKIPLLNRAQIINDVWNLVKAGEVSVDVALHSLEYLDTEKDYVPWAAAMRELGYLSDMLRETEVFGDYQTFMKEKVTDLFARLTLDDSNSTHLETLQRSMIGRAACSYGVTSCVTQASNMFQAWMDDPSRNKVDPDIKAVVYCTGISEGGQKEWDFAYSQYKLTKVASEKSILLSALACTSKTWILSHYLKLTMDPKEIRSQDVTNIIVYVSQNSVGRYLAWEFMQENWDTLREKFGSGFFKFAFLIKGVTESFNTGYQLKQLEDFVRTHPNLGTGQRAFREAIENTKSNKAWMERNYQTIKTWLEQMSSSTGGKKLTDVRLPRSNLPTLYEIELKPDIYSADPSKFKFYGHIKISIDCMEASTNITMHKNKLNVTNINVANQNPNFGAPGVVRQSEDKERQFLIIHLDGSLQSGQKYYLIMDFVGDLTNDLAGLYLSSYSRAKQTVYMATTQMEPTDARKAFPCFDEPALKAKFKLTLLRKPDKISLSNMPIVQKINKADGYVADIYQVSEKMSTYLVCIIICDFVPRTGITKNNITYSAWSTKEAYNQTELALDVGMSTITYYEDFFGIPFPLPKQDMIAIPDFSAGAMENWGLITYRETAMLYQPGVSSEINKQRVVTVITHELGHQWFGDLVTMKWWDDLWLNEGFATFVEYLGADHKYPEWKMFEQFSVAEVQSAFSFDGLVSSHPIYAPVYNPAEINEIFDTISYSKGGTIIRMMQWFLGDETFKKGLTHYLNGRKYSNAAHNDLWNAMSEQAKRDGQGRRTDVKRIMDTWTLQMNYPVVMVTVVNGKVRVQQKRFTQNPTAKDPQKYTSPFGYIWEVPFTFTVKSQPDFNQDWRNAKWFNTVMTDISVQTVINGEDWILGNVQQYGYYRVNYDRNNWLKLVQQLKVDHKVIHVINRGQLINDAWALAKSGEADMDIALKMVEYLGSEMDYVPWYAARKELSYVEKMMTRSNLYGKFKNFMHTLIKTPYDRLGMDNMGSGHLEIYTRSLLVSEACDYGIESCMSGAVRMYQRWMEDPINNRVDPDLKSTVYCTAVAEGGESEWNFAYQQYKETNVAAERRTLMGALACTKQTWILSKYLSMSLNPAEVRRQDGTYVIIYVSHNPIGRDLAWNFVKAHFDQLLELYGTSSFALKNLLNGVLETFNTEEDLQQLRDFKTKYPDMGSGTRAFDQVIEKTEANIDWMSTYYNTIEKWLDDNIAASSGDSSLKDVRLPRSVLPDLYTLELFPDIYQPSPANFTFSGSVKIDVRVVENTENITLHINKLTINESSVKVVAKVDGAVIPISSFKQDKDRQFFIILLRQPLQMGTNYSVSINFKGPLTDDLAGLYYSSYKRGDQTLYMATTQMEPVDARKSFPCFDEPDLKAKFKVTLVRKADKISLSNMRIERTDTRPNGLLADVYEESVPMSTYLACFIVCDFKNISKATPNGILYGAWSRPEAIQQAEFALEVGVDTITFYENYFGIPFPLKKQDMIAIPDFAAGAMENWGLITYRETAMLYDPVMSSESNKQRVTVVITHELGHQWFGDLVTMGWWDDLWLNEGFATFVEYLGADHKFPEWKMFEQFVTEDLHVAFDFDGLVTSHPIYVPVANPDEINEIFDKISYSKGGSIIRMMRFFLGEDTFRAGLTDYLDSRRYGNSFHDDLWNSMTKLSNQKGRPVDVKAVMDTWTLQMNYPVVTLTRQDSGHLLATQKRFLSNPAAKDPMKFTSDFGYRWMIPFTYTTETSKKFSQSFSDIVWFNDSVKDIAVNVPAADWILGNVQEIGYYRMNYDLDNWNKLIGQLKADHKVIHTTNRAQLINDAWSLAKAGELPMEIALQTIEYLGDEMDYVPWTAAEKQLSYVQKMLVRTSLYGKYKNFMSSLLKKPFQRLGLDNSKSSHLEIYTRSDLASLACSYDVPSCRDQVKRIFDQWMTNPSVYHVDPNLKTLVYCTGVAEGDESEWNFVLQQYKQSTLAAESSRLLYALACSKQTWLLSRYLELILHSDLVRKQDAVSVINYISQNTIGKDLVWNSVRQNWEQLRRDYGGGSFSFSKLISGITESFNTELELQQLRDLVKNSDLGAATRAGQQAIEKTQANIEWMKKNVPIIEKWLDRTAPPSQVNTDVRLPRSVLPELYTLELFPDLYQADPRNFTFSGNLTILVNCTENTSNITLHSNKITIDENSIVVKSLLRGGNLFSSLSRDDELMFSVFNLNSELVAGEQYELSLRFTGPLKDDLHGLYYSTYTSQNQTKYLATTQMEPVDARKSFPCFDEPDMKAMFKVTLVRQNNYKSLSNMEVQGFTNRGNNLVADEYHVTPRMSTYLLAFIVCQFERTSTTTQNGIVYSAWSLPEAVNDTKFGLEVGNKTITYYEEYFNIPFPLKKQDMIAIPDFSAGAMENWGLITYRETAMLFKPGVSSEGNRQRVTTVITHELAHQWFGNLVTMKWWDDLWLNEGFATFVEYMGADHLFPEWKMWDHFILSELYSTFSIDAFVTSHPIYVPIKTVEEMEAVFDTISYAKGGSIIRMMRFFLGEQNFRQGLHLYLESRKYGNAFHDDLWDAMDKIVVQKNLNYPASIREIMHTWILQMNYPVVTVTVPRDGLVQVKQNRFLRNPDAKDPLVYISPFGYEWWVPLTYTTKSENKFNKERTDVEWFNTTSQDFTNPNVKKSDWIIANINQYGVYRVNYTVENWRALIEQLKQNHSVISTINRAQIINDAWSFARSNQLDMGVALDTVDYLSNERDYIPRVAAENQLAYIDAMLSVTKYYGAFMKKMQLLVKDIYNEIGLNNTGATHLQSYMRSTVSSTACSYDIPECLSAAEQQYKDWMSNPNNNKIDPGLKYTVYCTAIKQGGQAEWDFAYSQYKSSQVASERAKLLSALSCTRVPWLLKRFLEYAVTDGEVRKQDGTSVIAAVGRNVIGRPIAWNFVRSRWDYIMNEYSEGQWSAGGFISSISGAFNTKYQLQQLTDFGKAHPDLGRSARAYNQAVEAVQSNVQWMQKNLDTVINWLGGQA
ncbi:putative aminopeptidase-2 isoform X2 [Ostrea edulis]|nr:putative aminopeptidase-2 isoform X2 [Ostrea edulis]